MRGISPVRAESGLTLVEVMVAALILVLGVSGTLALVDGANSATSAGKEVEGATNLAREITEQARSLPYGSVTSTTFAPQLQQSAPDLASTSPQPTWTVNRRGIVYTIDAVVCSIDDPKDGSGSPASAEFCPNLGPQSSVASDPAPEDFKRVSVAVSWQRPGADRRYVRQVVTLSPRGADAPGVAALLATDPVFPDPSAPVVGSTSVTSVTFKVIADSRATSIVYSVDGVDRGRATATGGDWTFTLDVSDWTDRTYEIGARAEMAGFSSSTYIIPLVFNRYAATAPSGLEAGVNKVYVNGQETLVAELHWAANPEANVVGYRVYRPDGSRACPSDSGSLSRSTTACVDFSPVYGQYRVVAVYEDASGFERESALAAATVSAGAPRSFYFADATVNTGSSGCPGTTPKRDMLENFAGSSNALLDVGGAPRFCSPPLWEGIAPASGTGTLTAYLQNSSVSKTCLVTPSVSINGSSSTMTLPTKTVPAGSATALYEWTFAVSALSVGSGDQVNATFSPSDSVDCGKTDLHYSGTTNRSGLKLPLPYERPAPPTGLTATQTADGLKLNWQAPASGPAPAFYRIYRDGYDYANRYDRTSDNSTAYVDPDRDLGSHSYYVTSVTDRLAESTPAPLAPATFP
jgi:Tfp pilus assembly protein PilV